MSPLPARGSRSPRSPKKVWRAVQRLFDFAVAARDRAAELTPLRRFVETHSVLKAMGNLAGRAVLDLGCGSGQYARLFRAEGAGRVVGLDSSKPMVEYASRWEARVRSGITYLCGDAAGTSREAGPGPLRGFDLVTAVYLLPDASCEEEFAAFCATARQALAPRGGRFVAVTLNPDFATCPQWYWDYGLTLHTDQPAEEGASVLLTTLMGNHVVQWTAHRWSVAAQERALRRAGFSTVDWSCPEVSAAGRERLDNGFWANYLTRPHSLIVEAVAEPGVGPFRTDPRSRPGTPAATAVPALSRGFLHGGRFGSPVPSRGRAAGRSESGEGDRADGPPGLPRSGPPVDLPPSHPFSGGAL
ncbi:class I SAM-dependent methyltransferase [Streptomyces sp. NPDC090025]|uniref:class I SAM-dependent methyltransferase n=1 Tax=Streptomyces sp. NPDC090025 TaxID=3365922 RepID=UPI003837074D